MKLRTWPLLILLSAGTFLLSGEFTEPRSIQSPVVEDRVVISAPIQLLLSGGDRYLAADMEEIRSAASGTVSSEDDAIYRIRAHRVVSQLNPCHEDNYYLGNALLTWGGAVEQGNELLRNAMHCRTWDEIPPFFYGFNLHFFYRNNPEAIRVLEIAAQRSAKNYATLKKTAIMLALEDFDNDQLALDYLKIQRDQASDTKLKIMLDKRVIRLEGLIALREAQKHFEQKFHRNLTQPNELIEHKFLESIPRDPLGLGYEFREGTFMLRHLKISGMENK